MKNIGLKKSNWWRIYQRDLHEFRGMRWEKKWQNSLYTKDNNCLGYTNSNNGDSTIHSDSEKKKKEEQYQSNDLWWSYLNVKYAYIRIDRIIFVMWLIEWIPVFLCTYRSQASVLYTQFIWINYDFSVSYYMAKWLSVFFVVVRFHREEYRKKSNNFLFVCLLESWQMDCYMIWCEHQIWLYHLDMCDMFLCDNKFNLTNQLNSQWTNMQCKCKSNCIFKNKRNDSEIHTGNNIHAEPYKWRLNSTISWIILTLFLFCGTQFSVIHSFILMGFILAFIYQE